jgi:RNA polymerase sigma-70 factor (ECF subfamily)
VPAAALQQQHRAFDDGGGDDAQAVDLRQRRQRASPGEADQQEAEEDAVQDALLSAFKHISRFQGRSCISTWLHRIVINSARMQIRRRRGRVFVSLDGTGPAGEPDLMHELPDSALSPDQSYQQTELRALVHEVVNLLPVQLRSALQLRHLQELTTNESAKVLGLSPGTSKSRVHRAKAKLTTLLADRGLPLVANERSKHGQSSIFHDRNGNPLRSRSFSHTSL